MGLSVSPAIDSVATRGHSSAVAIIGLMFFIFGFVTWLNGPLITFVKLAFTADDKTAFLVPMAFYLSYLFFALPASLVLRRTGLKLGMTAGLLIMAVGTVVFGEFTSERNYPGVLTGLFVIGAGLALLQTAANPYISIVGPIESAARRIAVMGICNKLGGVLAPLVFGALVLHGLDDFAARVTAAAGTAEREVLLDAFARQVYAPYMAMAGLLALLAAFVMAAPLPDVAADDANATAQVEDGTAVAADRSVTIFNFPHLWLGVVALFLYVGVEVLAGDAIGVYGDGFRLPLGETRLFTSYTLVFMLAGYCVGVLLTPRFVAQEAYLAGSAALGVVLTLAATLTEGFLSVSFIAALGFANAMMWPAIFPLAIRGLGRLTETGSALLVMAIAGGAMLPYGFALLKEHVDFQIAYALMAIPGYLFIGWYGAVGHRCGRVSGLRISARS